VSSDPVEDRSRGDGKPVLHVRLKVVPGASRDVVDGVLGDRIKVRVAAPPESGRANKAVAALLARALGVAPSAVRVIRGLGDPRKTVEVHGVDADEVRRRLGG
jgi:uncharacterized protein (TIGR00251 family)